MTKRLFKIIVLSLCFIFISFSLTACQKSGNSFFKGAKKYLNNKYGVTCADMVYYEPAKKSGSYSIGGTLRYTASEFGVIELDTGERVIVALAGDNYSDSYELPDLHAAWMEELSADFNANVITASVMLGGPVTYSNGVTVEKQLGSFIEVSQKRYNRSNIDDFMNDFYSFISDAEITFYIAEQNPSPVWLGDLSDKLTAFQNQTGISNVYAKVYDHPFEPYLKLDPDDYNYPDTDGGSEYLLMIPDDPNNTENTWIHIQNGRVHINPQL